MQNKFTHKRVLLKIIFQDVPWKRKVGKGQAVLAVNYRGPWYARHGGHTTIGLDIEQRGQANPSSACATRYGTNTSER